MAVIQLRSSWEYLNLDELQFYGADGRLVAPVAYKMSSTYVLYNGFSFAASRCFDGNTNEWLGQYGVTDFGCAPSGSDPNPMLSAWFPCGPSGSALSALSRVVVWNRRTNPDISGRITRFQLLLTNSNLKVERVYNFTEVYEMYSISKFICV